MAHNAIQIIFTYNAIKYLSHLKLHKVSHRDLYEFIFKSNRLLVVKNDQDDRKSKMGPNIPRYHRIQH